MLSQWLRQQEPLDAPGWDRDERNVIGFRAIAHDESKTINGGAVSQRINADDPHDRHLGRCHRSSAGSSSWSCCSAKLAAFGARRAGASCSYATRHVVFT